jgi:hypothetical protein
MNEMFRQAGGPDLPVEDREYFELLLLDPPNFWGDTYIVERTHYEWNDAQELTLPADYIVDRLKTLADAKARYEVHRQILAEMGFVHLDTVAIL